MHQSIRSHAATDERSTLASATMASGNRSGVSSRLAGPV